MDCSAIVARTCLFLDPTLPSFLLNSSLAWFSPCYCFLSLGSSYFFSQSQYMERPGPAQYIEEALALVTLFESLIMHVALEYSWLFTFHTRLGSWTSVCKFRTFYLPTIWVCEGKPKKTDCSETEAVNPGLAGGEVAVLEQNMVYLLFLEHLHHCFSDWPEGIPLWTNIL